MSLFLAVLFFTASKSAIISPTKTIGDTEYYNTSTDSEFHYDDIICGTATCVVTCDNTDGCQRAEIDASSSTTLIIECLAEQSCDSMTVNADQTTNINITCDYNTTNPGSSTASCDGIEVNARNADSFYFYSNYYNGYGADIYVTDANSATFYFEHYRSGYDSKIYAENVQNQLSIFCNGEEACSGMDVFTDQMSAAANVFMSCEGKKACYSSVQPGTMAADLTVECKGSNIASLNGPCSLFDIAAIDMVGTLNVNCLTSRSCNYIDISCPVNCNVDCSMVDYACQDARFYVADRLVDPNKLNINCGNSSVSCQSADITCKNNNAGGSLDWNDTLNEWYCQRKGCCPWFLENITCVAGVDCELDCAAQDCIGYVLDARQATSLTLGCIGGTQFGGSWTCEGLYILAPQANDASITLNCGDSKACSGAQLITDTNPLDKLELNCNAGSSNSGCSKMTVELNAVSVNNALFNCDDTTRYLCSDMNVMSTSNIANLSINCASQDGCDSSKFIFTGLIDSFDMDCTGEMACNDVTFEGTIANDNLMLNCIGDDACSGIDLNINFTSINPMLEVKCSNPSASSLRDGACELSSFNINGNGGTTSSFSVDCEEKEDCKYGKFNIYDTNTVDINCKGQDSCLDFAYTGSATYVNVNCSSQTACKSSVIDCPYDMVNACNIYCSSDGNSCEALEINVPSDYTYNYLNLNCDASDSNGIDTANTCLNFKIDCASVKTDVNYIYDAVNGYICNNVGASYCCPYIPTTDPTETPSNTPSKSPITAAPTGAPSKMPSQTPTETTDNPSKMPSTSPSKTPSETPTEISDNPSATPTQNPAVTTTSYETSTTDVTTTYVSSSTEYGATGSTMEITSGSTEVPQTTDDDPQTAGSQFYHPFQVIFVSMVLWIAFV